MIKCNVKLCGTVKYPAKVKSRQDGSNYTSFVLEVPLTATKGEPVSIDVNVAIDNFDHTILTGGKRVAVEGVMNIKGAPGKMMYFNMSASSIVLDAEEEPGVSGDMEFRGTLCKDIVTPTDKKGNKYLRFSAYSTDKVGENFYSVFVRFVRFESEIPAFMVPKVKIEAKGTLRISSFNSNVDLNCKLTELKEWVKVPF